MSTAEGVFWLTPEARWQYLNQRAKRPEIGKLIDNAMDLIEVDQSQPAPHGSEDLRPA
jgi:type I restriction enzyme M protein